MILLAANFFIVYNGLTILLENYLQKDRLPITYFFLLGLVSAIIAFLLNFVTRGKRLWVNGVVTMLLLIVIVLLNVFTN